MRIGVIGAGQLGRMLALAGYPLSLQFRFLDASADSPGGQVAPIVTGAFDDPQSLERLAQSPMTTLYPAHGPAMRDGHRLVKQYLRHRRQRETALVNALAVGGLTVDELLRKVYWDADPKLFPFAARSLLAGLQKLQEEGRAVENAGRWSAVR